LGNIDRIGRKGNPCWSDVEEIAEFVRIMRREDCEGHISCLRCRLNNGKCKQLELAGAAEDGPAMASAGMLLPL